MGQGFDDETIRTMLGVSVLITAIVATFSLYGRLMVLPRLQQVTGDDSVPRLTKEIGLTIAWMAIGTTLLTYPITLLSNTQEKPASSTSSINFCEADFVHSAWVAEPANTISNLFAYLPLATIGLDKGSSSKLRFQLCYVTIGMIGAGSTLLHANLTAMTQGGDELPMLWFTSASAYCGFNILFSSRSNKLVGPAVLLCALLATTVYLNFRANYIVFALMFDTSVVVLILSLVHITLFKKWSTDDTNKSSADEGVTANNGTATKKTIDKRSAAEFQQFILYPLGQTAAWTIIPAIWVWVSEVVYCKAVTDDDDGSPLLFILWNRCLHPLWHYLTGNLAMVVVQIFYAADGYSSTGNIPSIVWYGVPLVVFDAKKKKE